MHGAPFERERTLTAVVVPGINLLQPDATTPNDLCTLVHCLGENGAISSKLQHKLKELGLDFPALLKCLDEKCHTTADELEGRPRPKR